jgi:hypothetical protein
MNSGEQASVVQTHQQHQPGHHAAAGQQFEKQ